MIEINAAYLSTLLLFRSLFSPPAERADFGLRL